MEQQALVDVPHSDLAAESSPLHAQSANDSPGAVLEGWSATVAARVSGVSYRQLDHWARSDLVKPSVAAAGSGSRRLYSYTDLLKLRLVKRLADAGFDVKKIRDVFNNMCEQLDAADYRANVVISGSDVVVAHNDELMSLLEQPGQGAFFVAAMATVRSDVDDGLEGESIESEGLESEGLESEARGSAQRGSKASPRRVGWPALRQERLF